MFQLPPILTYICGVIALALGLLLIFGGNNVENNNAVYKLLVGPISTVAGIVMLLSPVKRVLVVDKSVQELSVKKGYLFGLLPITRRVKLSELTKFEVQHQLAFRLRPATLKFIFKQQRLSLTFTSSKLHFPDGSSFFDPGAYDPRNSSEEALIPMIANYINMSATPKERLTDTTNLNRRLFYFALILVGGFVFIIGATWVYYHLLRTG